MNNDSIVQLHNLDTGYRLKKQNKVIGKSLNASLNIGELTCLLGPNGAGKSTLLRTIAGFQPALTGKVLIDHQDAASYSQKQLAKLVSVVLTNNHSIRNMTAEEVVAIGRSPYTGFWGTLRRNDKRMVEQCLEWVEISDLAQRKIETLSDGERQKVMIAKAIAQETPIILLDEPTAYLDYPSKMSMLMLLHRLAKALKKTIFLSTHDLEHALHIADKVWLLDNQHGLTTGMPEDLIVEGKIEEYFQRDGISFDSVTGSFNIQHQPSREIILEGDRNSLNYKLTCQALLRNGMQAIDSIQAAQIPGTRDDVKILITPEGQYQLIDNGNAILTVNRIEHILGTAKSTIVKNHIQAVRDAAHMTNFE